MTKWETREAANAREVHVLPVDDGIEHLAENCPCGVTTEPVEGEHGNISWLITHHSLDGRENQEATDD